MRRAVTIARDINWDEELSDEDRAWAEQRLDAPAGFGKTIGQRLVENDVKFGRETKLASMTRAERIEHLRGVIANAQNEIERLEVEQANEDNPNVAVTGDPKVGLIVDNTGVDGKRPEGAPEEREDYSNAKYWTVPKLQEEIRARNEERVSQNLEPIAVDGKRAELVERLLRDDEELEA